MPAEERRKRDEEDCVSCHMPKGATDIPHIAFTHHRIGIHEPTSDEGHLAESRKGMELEAPRLVPSVSLEHLSPGDQARCLGVAYVELAGQQMSPRLAAACRLQAERLLRRAYELGVRDALVTATLAGLEMERGRAARALDLVQQALRSPNGNTGAHENARFIRANIEAERGDFDQAAQTIREVLGARRRPEDWLMLAELEAQRGEWLEALRAARAAERMNPFRPEVHRALRQIETRAGDASQVEPRQQIERALIDGIRASQPRQ